jgi:hypothetical protein
VSTQSPTPSSPTSHCEHSPRCPSASDVDHHAAHVVKSHPEQGWSLLCNGVVLFEDLGEILPDGQASGARVIPLQHLRVATCCS